MSPRICAVLILCDALVLVDGACDDSAANSLLRGLVGTIEGEARRQRLNLQQIESLQYLDRVCSDTITQWAKPGNDKLNSAFEKIDQVKG